MKFEKMVIEIFNVSHLKKVLECLEKLGYFWTQEIDDNQVKSILCFEDGYVDFRCINQVKYTHLLEELNNLPREVD